MHFFIFPKYSRSYTIIGGRTSVNKCKENLMKENAGWHERETEVSVLELAVIERFPEAPCCNQYLKCNKS
jgi:hypothetical protein